MLTKLTLLEENKATLRLLFILHHECPSHTRTELIDTAKSHGVGTTSFYRSLNTLKELDLVLEKKENKKIIARLSKKGIEITKNITKINDILTTNTSS